MLRHKERIKSNTTILNDEINREAGEIARAITTYRDLRRWKLRESAYCSTLREGLVFYGIAQEEKPDIIFESGTALGWSSFWWALGGNCPVLTWDIEQREPFFNHHNVTRIIDSFDTGAPPYIEALKDKKKIIFLDGDHSFKAIKKEFANIESALQEDDLLVFHDSHTVSGVVNMMKKMDKWRPNWERRDYHTRNGITTFRCR